MAHNSSYDMHVLENALGHELRDGDYSFVDTLSLSRWLWPGRMQYGLKQLAMEILGREPSGTFKELFSRPVYSSKQRRIKVCSCGQAYKKLTDHRAEFPKAERKLHIDDKDNRVSVVAVTELAKRELIPLDEILPGHSKWGTLVSYAAEDAEWALELASYISNEMKERTREETKDAGRPRRGISSVSHRPRQGGPQGGARWGVR